MSDRRETVYVGLGANVGDRLAALRGAVEALSALPETDVAAVSPVYETEAHVLPGQPSQPDHLNAVVALVTALAPDALLGAFHRIERAAGRDPAAPRWSPRPLDLDLLLVGDRQIETAGLVVPHPRLGERRFVLQPLADLAPDARIPGLGGTVVDALIATPDAADVRATPFSIG